jgi:hypothetical protein
MQTTTRNRWLQLPTVGLFTLVCIVPLLGRIIPIPTTPLHGMSMSYPRPAWSLKRFRTGQYQRDIDQWSLREQPLWSWSVKAANQLVYALTGEISLDYRTSVQGGNEGYLWQPMYLKAFNRSKKAPRQKIVSTFRALKALQDYLATKGVPLIAVINPNLIMLYPELLPEKYKAVQARPSSYEVSREAIEKHRPDVIDAFQLLKSAQHDYPFRFFEPTGSHWNEIGSCLAVREVASELAAAWKENIPPPQCKQYSLSYPPRPSELDLVEIANLLHPEGLYREAPYLSSHPGPSYKKPRSVLLVGTSFLFGLEKQLLEHHLADSTTLLFYFRQSRKDGKGNFRFFDKKKMTVEDLLAYDAIIVDVNAAGPGILGYGFLEFGLSRFGLSLPPEPRAPSHNTKGDPRKR